MPVRFWIPHSDVEDDSNKNITAKLLDRLGLLLKSSGVSWAAYTSTT